MDVNKKIKQYLDDHGISQTFLAEKTNIKRANIHLIVNSKRKVTAEELGIICKALGVSPTIFFE